jgi:hypothetical protein
VPLLSQCLHDAVELFWAHHPALTEELGRPLHRRQLCLELGDPQAGCAQLSRLLGGRPGELAPVDAILALPAVERGGMDTELGRHDFDLAALAQLLDDHRPKLRSVGMRHGCPPPGSAAKSRKSGPRTGGHIRWISSRGPGQSDFFTAIGGPPGWS